MSEGILTWSQATANNATASDAINWAENQPPPTINNSSRAMMSEVAKYRDDLAGVRPGDVVLTSTGNANAHVIAVSNGSIASPAVLTNGWEITWVAGFGPNTGPVTFAIDGMTPKPLRTVVGVPMAGGEILIGQMYTCIYHKTADEWLMKSGGGVGVPVSKLATVAEIRSGTLGKIMDTAGFWGTPFPVTLPDAAGAVLIPLNFGSGLNFKINITGTNAVLGNPITGGKPGQAGVIEIKASAMHIDVQKGPKVVAVATMFPLHIQTPTTAHVYYSVMPSDPTFVIITGIINNPG